MFSKLPEEKRISRRIALIYLVISVVWIFFSDRLVAAFVTDPETLTLLQTYKGWLFVTATAWLIYVLIRNNLTALEQSKLVLQESESKYRSLVESISDWVWEVDENTIFTYTNPRIYDILGYAPREIIGKKPYDFMTGDEAKRISKIFGEIEAARRPFNLLENTLLRKDGTPIILEVNGIPIFDSRGRFHGYRGIGRDITERKRAEEAILERDRGIRQAYVDVFSAVTGGRLIMMTGDEINTALGMPITGPRTASAYKDLAGTRAMLSETLHKEFPGFEEGDELLLAASEAVTNAVKHAGGGTFQIRKKDNIVQVEISDTGPGIDFKILPKATLLAGFSTKQSLGVGFSIMLELCDRVLLSTQPGSTVIVLEKYLIKEEELPAWGQVSYS